MLDAQLTLKEENVNIKAGLFLIHKENVCINLFIIMEAGVIFK